MTLYEQLKSKRDKVPEKFIRAFETGLQEAWQEYCAGARLVDQFEDNYTECAFAKGFLAGCIYRDHPRLVYIIEPPKPFDVTAKREE